MENWYFLVTGCYGCKNHEQVENLENRLWHCVVIYFRTVTFLSTTNKIYIVKVKPDSSWNIIFLKQHFLYLLTRLIIFIKLMKCFSYSICGYCIRWNFHLTFRQWLIVSALIFDTCVFVFGACKSLWIFLVNVWKKNLFVFVIGRICPNPVNELG